MYALVLVEIGVKNVDKYFTYHIPDNLEDKINIGIRVKVPFNTREISGFVIKIINKIEDNNYEVKDILEVIDNEEVLNLELLKLGEYISSKTLCSMITAYQTMLPKALKANHKVAMKPKNEVIAVLNKDTSEIYEYISICSYKKQVEILKSIIENGSVKVISSNISSVTSLANKGLIKTISREVYRYNDNTIENKHTVFLNEEQSKVVKEVIDNLNTNNTYLLKGVTGSGKTEVYMNIIKEVIDRGMQAIMLVPEISLTPQIVSRFRQRFNDEVAVLHSGLSDGERYDEYRKIKKGLVKIVVGARSAIFSPFQNLGVIIIDEEQVTSYKQENNPRYHTRDVALFRCKYHNCPLVLGSATPSLESYARAKKGVYKLLTLNKRANNKLMPEIRIVDMKKEIRNNYHNISLELENAIKEKLDKKEQIIILLNRRGYSSMLTCKDCGEVIKCPNCDISLTYHKTSNTLRCHYCGYGTKVQDRCPSCYGRSLTMYGLGTEKLEEELVKKFNARVVRMDLDTTTSKKAHSKIIKDFLEQKYDILVGTQMIAKGLDFPNVTLVGVINADASLNIPDFRSSEYTYQLLSQVSGRSGRDKKEGIVIIQTLNPEHYSIKYAKDHDYDGFFNYEMSIRKKLGYPPYYYLTLIKILSRDYQLCMKEANKVGEFLRKNLPSDVIVLGPSIASTFKVNNIYHFQCIIKYKKEDDIKEVLRTIDNIYKVNTKVRIEMDIDPVRL
ncbi:MAG: primosomal protein N' [Bacilli bacterium]